MATAEAVHRVPTRVGELRVRVEGAGPVAVLWHSLYVDDGSWDRVAPALRAERTLVRITGPGHGGSEARRAPYTLDDCAAAAVEVLDALGLSGPVDWVGNAWGGHTGIVLAAADPGRVRSLAAFNAPVQALSPQEAKGPRLLVALYRTLGPIPLAVNALLRALLSETTRTSDPEAVGYVTRCLRGANRRGLVNAMRSISLQRPDLRPLLPGIDTPVLLVATPGNPLWTPEQARAAAALMPRAEVAVVERAGHLTPLEAPEESIELLRALWASATAIP
ncbi:MAG: alpha/beta fold hydrolase [Microbacterium sp.]|nr:alpha/beta fold hydrolase [Microbacterium sp.]